MEKVELKVWLEDDRAVLPIIAYEGTSACFDLICIQDTLIPRTLSAMVPVGLRIVIPNGYYLEFATRSGHGIGSNLRVHPGIIDAGYSGELSIKVFNLGLEDYYMKAGKACVQVKVHKVPSIEFSQITQEEFNQYRENSKRGDNGFGSSDKEKK